ncbi:DegT/DnrJ/EryC1/StrS family aminotransferase [Endomicrobium proavitum]|uniref:Pleiotropic regulatory protein n=1 Tax=Endomicrobium proavitum TaxID=1408281 RepID=A0A0G3WK02_9BACT|nr:DegT/DnrJ/EryC1/StrS family aminotransferase [Endomicrobium proavitum]AKL97834.1 Pleiotropic regulatory protein [Endomicrobium proavitum]
MINIAAPVIGQKERKLINEVLDSRILAAGKYVTQFEQSFAKYSGAKFGIANANGTTSLHTALLMCGVKAGDKVVTTPFSFIATSNSILFCGAKPVFADIEPETFNISADSLEKILKKEKNVKAVVIVHLYGLPCDMDAILKLKKKYKFKLIEDACQAHGAQYKNKKVGSFGDAAAFSFYATKNMMTGEGGITLTNDAKADKYGRQIINHGRDGHSTFTVLGYNYRLTNLAAAIGIAQLEQLESWIAKRISNANKYNEAFKDLAFLQTPIVPLKTRHVFHQYTIRINPAEREKFMQYLKDNGVGCGIYYDCVLYKQPYYKQLGYKSGLCPNAEQAAKEAVSLPVHPSLSAADVQRVIDVVRGYKK